MSGPSPLVTAILGAPSPIASTIGDIAALVAAVGALGTFFVAIAAAYYARGQLLEGRRTTQRQIDEGRLLQRRARVHYYIARYNEPDFLLRYLKTRRFLALPETVDLVEAKKRWKGAASTRCRSTEDRGSKTTRSSKTQKPGSQTKDEQASNDGEQAASDAERAEGFTDEDRLDVLSVLNFFEELAGEYNDGLLEEDSAHRTVAYFAIGMWEAAEWFVLWQRATSGEHRFYEQWETMYQKVRSIVRPSL
jgi:hypothetical protein